MAVSLPTPESNTGTNDWSDVYGNDKALKEAVETLQAEVGGLTWYSPKIIAAEESRTNVAFGTMGTADEIKSVVVPENGLLVLSYTAAVKSSNASAGRAAVFLGSLQVKTVTAAAQEVSTSSTTFSSISAIGYGLVRANLGTPSAEPQFLGSETTGGAPFPNLSLVTAPAGTYDVSVQFKATSGSVTAKDRKLFVWVLGP